MGKPYGRAALATAAVLGLLTALGTGPAFASPGAAFTGGVKGSPQPELKPFRIAPSVSGGSVAIEPDGSLVVAYGIKSGHGQRHHVHPQQVQREEGRHRDRLGHRAGQGAGPPDAASGQAVRRWYTVGSTHETASGTFKFTIRGNGTGRHSFRAVASDRAGYVMYGYSAARSLRVIS